MEVEPAAAAGFEQRPFALPPGATEVVLVRHGASAAVVPGRPVPLLAGQSDPELSAAGRQGAKRLADHFEGVEVAGLFASTLRRTAETAAPLAALTGLEVETVPELRDVFLGELEGGRFRVLAARGDELIARVYAEERWDVIDGGEAPGPFAERVRRGIERVAAAVGPDRVAVAVVHDAVVAEACRRAAASRPFAFAGAENCSLSRLVVAADGRWLLRSFNESPTSSASEADQVRVEVGE